MAAIEVRDLHMAYGPVEAVRGIDLAVEEGELLAVLGPNGAGKTSTVEHLEGYRPRTQGEVRVLGEDPATAGRAWRGRIGVVLQESLIERELTIHEVLTLYAGYHAAPRPVDEVISLVGLDGLGDRRGARLSGGQQRRVDVALALIGDPELVFLDEPTTGFDPAARRATWEMIAGLKALGRTIVLTTHYLEEAEALADRIAVVVAGRIVAEGTARELRARGNPPSIVSFTGAAGPERIETHEPARTLHEVTERALADGRELPDLEVRRPTLEDVYLRLIAEQEAAA